MDLNDVVRGVTETLDDFCTFADEARIDDFMGLFCEDGRFDPGAHSKVTPRFGGYSCTR